MKKLFSKKIIAIAAGLFVSQFAFSQNVANRVENSGTVYIYGNTDTSDGSTGPGNDEGVFISSNTNNNVNPAVGSQQSYISLTTNGTAQMGSRGGSGTVITSFVDVGLGRVFIDGGGAEITVDETVSINTNTTIGGTLGVTGLSTTAGITNIGGFNQTGVSTMVGDTSITGTTSINTSGSLNTTIGNAANITTIQSGTNNMTATTANNIQGPLNNIGTSSVSYNFIGNASANTTVTATAGNASQALNNISANTTMAEGTSGLTARVGTPNVATTGQMLLSNTEGTTVDAYGKILANGATGYVNPAAPTAAVTLTNGYGNTHGLVVTESQTTLSGGTQSSSMTLNDRAATFSNAQTGAPITVTGVADGRADFDAVNVRQFAGAIASVAAQANIPALSAGQDRTFGMGVGNFMGKSALAMGMNIRGSANSVYKATVSSGLNGGARKAVVGVGGAWGF